MPEVPTESLPDQQQPGVAEGGKLTANVSPKDFGDISQGLESLGTSLSEVDRIRQRAMHQANMSASLAADNTSDDFVNQRLYHPQTGILNQNLGKQAPVEGDKVLSDYDALVSKNTASLANEQQRQIYGRMAAQRRQGLQRQLYQYEDRQIKQYATEQDTAAIANSRTTAANTYDTIQPDLSDPVDFEIEKQHAIIRDAAARNGLPPQAIELQTKQADSATYSAVLDQMINKGQDQQAKDFFEKHKDDLLPDVRDHLGKSVDITVDRATVSRLVPSLVLDKDGQPKDRAQIYTDMEASKEIQARPQIEQDVRQRVDKFLADRDKAVKEQQNQAFDGAGKILEATGGDLSKIPPQNLAAMSGEHLKALREWSENVQRGLAPKDNGDTYQTLLQLAGSESKDPNTGKPYSEVFTTMDMRSLNDVSPADRTKLIDMQNHMRDAEVKGAKAPNMPWIQTRTQINDQALSSLGIPSRPVIDHATGKVTFDPKLAEFMRATGAAVDAQEKATGKPIDPAGYQKIVDAQIMMTAKQVPVGWLQRSINYSAGGVPGTTTTQVPAFLNRPKGFVYGASQIPADWLSAERAKAKAAGVTIVSDDDLVNKYNRGLPPAP